jgi:pyridoxal phosphate enzyme (YggS family)
MSIASNIALVRGQIASAAKRVGRSPSEIALMAVTKTVPPDRIREAYNAGLRLFGENRVQEFSGKAGALRDLHDADWHLIGHLQTNKAAKAVELFAAIESVDSLRLAQKLNTSAQQLGKKLAVLIEINVGGEAAKSGMAPDSGELANLLRAAPALEHLEFRGLMTVPPFINDP